MTAYRGYLITTSPFCADVAISKGGVHVRWAPSVEAARRAIDELLVS